MPGPSSRIVIAPTLEVGLVCASLRALTRVNDCYARLFAVFLKQLMVALVQYESYRAPFLNLGKSSADCQLRRCGSTLHSVPFRCRCFMSMTVSYWILQKSIVPEL